MGRKQAKVQEQPIASSSKTKLHVAEPSSRKRKRNNEETSSKPKRKKSSHSSKADGEAMDAAKPTGRRWKDLSLLHTMPFDVIYEILVRLAVRDVVSVSRVNKEWCKLLSSSDTTGLWKELRLQEGVPEPHPDMPESAWACFLFGGHNREVCGAKNIQAPDFGIRRRVCSWCKKDRLVPENQLGTKFKQYDKTIAEFLPFTTYNGSWMHANERRNSFYWPDDIHSIGKAWNALQVDVRKGLPGAKVKANEYRQRMTTIREAIEESVKPCMKWCTSVVEQKSTTKYEASQSRKEAIYTRFRELGYTDSDLWWIRWDSAVIQERKLTERIWKRIRPVLEETLRPRKRDRLVKERSRFLVPAYDLYMTSITPTDRIAVPTLKELLDSPTFDALAWAEEGAITVDFSVVSTVAAQLPTVIADWQKIYKEGLRKDLSYTRPTLGLPSFTVISGENPDPLELAVSVFSCSGFPCRDSPMGAIFGWKSSMQHRFCKEFHPSFKASTKGNIYATHLILLAGLDPQTATIEDMDKSDLRVICKNCSEYKKSSGGTTLEDVGGGGVLTWRQAVGHAVHPNMHYGEPSWQQVEPAQLPHLFEVHNSKPGLSEMWSCNHCSVHYPNPSTLAKVREHLNQSHDIQTPVFPADIFSPGPFTERRGLGFSLKLWEESGAPPETWIPHGRFICKYCSHCSFELHRLEEHLRENHEILRMEEKDYIVRKYWLGYMPPPGFKYPVGEAPL